MDIICDTISVQEMGRWSEISWEANWDKEGVVQTENKQTNSKQRQTANKQTNKQTGNSHNEQTNMHGKHTIQCKFEQM